MPRVLPFGDAAILVELEPAGLVEGARAARALAAAVDALRAVEPGLGSPVPAATSVLVPFDPLAMDADRATALVGGLTTVSAPTVSAVLHRVPVRYGGDDGPDLDAVAAELGVAPAEVVALHAATEVEVLFLGFAPGFAYLGAIDPRLVVPRLPTPRVHVPAGSVAIAGPTTAIYPQASPGGWRLLGRTDLRCFDPSAAPPARFRPGDRVRFEPA